ncbi:MAG: hypothetical protein HZA88_17320 [Verrucomicrobia bacterium]|nr:hypothetical protein [Verrucomicrobiota bacterium]
MAGRPNPDRLTLLYIPSLAALLVNVEGKLGRELTRKEVEILRDQATVMAADPEKVRVLEEKRRGYKDLDPANVWEEYQRLRAQMKNEN